MAVDDGVREQLQTLGAFIRAQRQQAQMSLRDLADLTNVSNPYLSQIERGLHEPSMRVLKSISDALEVSIDTLLARAGLDHRGQRRRRRPGRRPTTRRVTPSPPSSPTPPSTTTSAQSLLARLPQLPPSVARPSGPSGRSVADVTLAIASKVLTFHAVLGIVSSTPPHPPPPRGEHS